MPRLSAAPAHCSVKPSRAKSETRTYISATALSRVNRASINADGNNGSGASDITNITFRGAPFKPRGGPITQKGERPQQATNSFYF